MVGRVFMPAIKNGDPVLLAFVRHQVAGVIFWVRNGMSVDTAVGYGTYVCPEFRRLGVGKKLREQASDELRKLGVKRCIGFVHFNNPLAAASTEHGYEKIGYLIEKKL
jgi:GNAT superfamily N-acetyltransferase